jgi:hypothetical protein
MFLISYFMTDDESMFLASSHDGVAFRPLNEGKPVLRGEVGTATLRDPFIGLGRDGLFHLVATDGWRSTSIVHASSTTLLDWSPQRLVPVMADVPGARNAWAPEFFTDPATNLIHLIWSSLVDVDVDIVTTEAHEHRIWGTTTVDFDSFEPARLFFDPGHAVIDATVQVASGGFLMAFKDERGINHVQTAHKNISITTFIAPGAAAFAKPVRTPAPPPVEAPSLFRRDQEWILLYDRFLEGSYGALSTSDLSTWEPASIWLPPGMRHASVLHVPEAAWPL